MAKHHASEAAVDLRAKSFELPSADQFWLASMVAENVGYVLVPAAEDMPGIAIQRLARVMSERIAKSTGADEQQINIMVFDSLRDVVGWKLFDKPVELEVA